MNPITSPYDASAIAANHSSITGLIAGFALAGLFLLVEQVGSSSGFRSRRPDPVGSGLYANIRFKTANGTNLSAEEMTTARCLAQVLLDGLR